MAQKTTAEEIADLEEKILVLDNTIKNQQAVDELQEGGGNTSFRTAFTKIEKLYSRRDTLDTRLQTLYRGTA